MASLFRWATETAAVNRMHHDCATMNGRTCAGGLEAAIPMSDTCSRCPNLPVSSSTAIQDARRLDTETAKP